MTEDESLREELRLALEARKKKEQVVVDDAAAFQKAIFALTEELKSFVGGFDVSVQNQPMTLYNIYNKSIEFPRITLRAGQNFFSAEPDFMGGGSKPENSQFILRFRGTGLLPSRLTDGVFFNRATKNSWMTYDGRGANEEGPVGAYDALPLIEIKRAVLAALS